MASARRGLRIFGCIVVGVVSLTNCIANGGDPEWSFIGFLAFAFAARETEVGADGT